MRKRVDNEYNVVVHSKPCRKSVIVKFHHGFVNYGLIIFVKVIFQMFANFLKKFVFSVFSFRDPEISGHFSSLAAGSLEGRGQLLKQ